ncbi:MAG: pilus assembly PilX family protein, partial [Comamonas sp.]
MKNKKQIFHNNEQGLSLVIVLILLSVVMLLGISAVQISLMGEHTARNDRDYQIAWQSAEAGLQDGELDIDINNTGTSTRKEV